MTVEEYDSLKRIDTEEVLNRMKGAIDWKDIADNTLLSEDQHAMILACFVLWNIKRKEKTATVADYYKYCTAGEMYEVFDDVLGFLDGKNRWHDFLLLKDRFTNEELVATVVLSKYWNDDDPTQEGILSLADRILDIKDGQKVVNYCAYDHEFSLYSALRHPGAWYTGYEDSYSKHGIADARRQMLGIENLDIYGELDNIIEADKSFSSAIDNDTMLNNIQINCGHEPIIRRLAPEIILTRELAILTMSLTDKGCGVMLIKAGPLSSQDYYNTRSSWVSLKSICGVIALPEKLYGNTWVNIYMLVFRKWSNSIRFCDAREKYVKDRDKGKQRNVITEEYVEEIYNDFVSGNEFSKTISYEEVMENDYIMLPQRYIKQNVSRNSITIGECLEEIDRGITLSAKEIDKLIDNSQTKGIKCIMPSSLANGVVVKPFRFDLNSFDRKVNYAQKGDLLVNKTGKPIRVAVSDDRYIVVGNTYILKLNQKKIDPYYVKTFLETPRGQKEFEKYAVGSNTPMISIPNLQKVEIPLYKGTKQLELESKAREFSEKMQNMVYEMAEMESLFD